MGTHNAASELALGITMSQASATDLTTIADALTASASLGISTFTAASEAIMLALTVSAGDTCHRSDTGDEWRYITGDSTIVTSWRQIVDTSTEGILNTVFIPRADTSTNLDAIAGVANELAIDTTNNRVRLMDGENNGGALLFADLESSSTKYVEDTGSATTNGTNLRAAYTAAALLTPGGNILSATNRALVLIGPGAYDLGTGSGSVHGLEMTAEFVDLVGLVDRDAFITFSAGSTASRGTIEQTADDVLIANLTLTITGQNFTQTETHSTAYFPSDNLSSTRIKNVQFNGDLGAMRMNVEYSGTYEDCECTSTGGFAGCLTAVAATGSIFSGTARRCIAGSQSFGYGGGIAAGGTLYDCTGVVNCFGCATTDAEAVCAGTLYRCVSDDSSYGRTSATGGTFSGTAYDCVGVDYCFGGAVTGTLHRCVAGDYSFGHNPASAKFGGFLYGCVAGNDSFGNSSTGIEGYYYYCRGGNNAFSDAIDAAARLHYCSGGPGSFGAKDGSARTLFCVDNEVPYIGNDNDPPLVHQATPATVTDPATLTTTQMLSGIITGTQSSGSTNAITLPTGTAMDAGMQGFDDQAFEVTFINLSAALADTYTLTAGATFTIVGQATIDSAHADSEFPSSAVFRCRKTASNTYVAYRIS